MKITIITECPRCKEIVSYEAENFGDAQMYLEGTFNSFYANLDGGVCEKCRDAYLLYAAKLKDEMEGKLEQFASGEVLV
jgi:hypothetical protein